MKVTYHIPTEQYGFVEVEYEKNIGDKEDLELSDYQTVKALVSPEMAVGQGLDTKVFNDALTEYMLTNELRGGLEFYNQMNEKQQFVFQEVKKAFKRIKAKELKDNEQ